MTSTMNGVKSMIQNTNFQEPMSAIVLPCHKQANQQKLLQASRLVL